MLPPMLVRIIVGILVGIISYFLLNYFAGVINLPLLAQVSPFVATLIAILLIAYPWYPIKSN